MSDTGFLFILANRYLQPATRVQPHTIAPSRMRTMPASWCQLCRNLGAEILFAVSCQPVITLLIEIYPWSSSCCTLLGRVCYWECPSCIRTSVRRGVVVRPFASLTWSRRVFFINSSTVCFRVLLHSRVECGNFFWSDRIGQVTKGQAWF